MIVALLDIRIPPLEIYLLLAVVVLLLGMMGLRILRGRKVGTRLVVYTAGAAILAAVFFALYTQCRDRPRARASYGALRADLRNIQSAQEIYWGDGNRTYSGSIEELRVGLHDGVRIEIVSHDARGFGAVGRHDALDVTCAVYVGAEHRTAPATEPGTIVCEPGLEPRWCPGPPD